MCPPRDPSLPDFIQKWGTLMRFSLSDTTTCDLGHSFRLRISLYDIRDISLIRKKSHSCGSYLKTSLLFFVTNEPPCCFVDSLPKSKLILDLCISLNVHIQYDNQNLFSFIFFCAYTAVIEGTNLFVRLDWCCAWLCVKFGRQQHMQPHAGGLVLFLFCFNLLTFMSPPSQYRWWWSGVATSIM